MAQQLGFYLNASACNGCKACAIACKSKNNLPVGINWRRVYQYAGGGWVPDPDNPTLVKPNNIFSYAVSVACMHCQDAKCVEICPAGAMTKNADGIVTIDADKCIGCRYCEWACPYGAPQFNETAGVMTKCNACADLVAQGQKPACVDACVMRALDFGELSELRARHGVVDAIEPLPAAGFTRPSLVITPHRHAQPSGTGTGHIVQLIEEG
jgi:anaerobic dimethyl sulfoxide reductase subunit B (iron-sulfur subunit)